MEQIKLITDCTIEGLQKKINKFMASLDEDTDIVGVHIDSEYTDGMFKIYKDHLLATIRYTDYKEEHKSDDILSDQPVMNKIKLNIGETDDN